jgi:hypothetical protein
VLDAAQSPALTSLSVGASAPVNGIAAGDLVRDLADTAGISDTDSGAVKGIAITDVNSGGTLYYSLDGGLHWLSVTGAYSSSMNPTGVSSTHALLLAADADTRVMYKSSTAGDVANAITFRAWDRSQHHTEGVYANTTANGGSAEFSSATDTIKATVTVTALPPVVLDLNRDGVLSYGQVTMDVNGDGHLDATRWAGAGDGVLVWDKYQDGHVHDNSQYAFAQYANNANGADATDLSGLADAFDSNHDGKFNAQDAKFAEFKVWQDVNQNGVSEATEVRSLADWGLTEINLSSDGVQRTPAAGVTEAGRTTASATDGTQVLVSDAAFAYNSLAYSVSEGAGDAGVKLNLLGSEMSLDLSSFTARYGHVWQVDVSGTGANTLKINLSDVLQGAQTGTLQVTGNADDTVLLDANVWTNTGSVVQGDGHTYALYSAANGLAAQLLLDQQMVQHVA